MLTLRLAMTLSLLAVVGLSSCSQCTSTDCGNGRSTTYCTKQGKYCDDCLNHKVTDERGNTLYGCEDAYENGRIVSCRQFMLDTTTQYCASGKVCTGLYGTCSVNSDCCTGVCGSVTKQCITP
jgi:hypothetical protein